MAIAVTDRITRGQSGLSPFAVAWEEDLKISYTTVVDTPAMEAIPEWKRVPFMTVMNIVEGKEYVLGADITIAGQVWTEKTYGVPSDVVVEGDIFDVDGFIQPQLIKNIFLNTNYVVDDEAEMLALTTSTGNFVIRTDTSEVYIKLNNDDPADITDFALASGSAAVLSVNGATGVVSVTIANLLAVGANLTAFNAAVEANSLVSQHTADISALDSDFTTLSSSVADLSDYVYSHIGQQALSSIAQNPTVSEVGHSLIWNGTEYTLSSISGGGSMVYPAEGIPISTGSAWGASITNNSANWNTAFGWGNHASAGYLTSLANGNGTIASGNAINLGGNLSQNTTITRDNFNLSFGALGAEGSNSLLHNDKLTNVFNANVAPSILGAGVTIEYELRPFVFPNYTFVFRVTRDTGIIPGIVKIQLSYKRFGSPTYYETIDSQVFQGTSDTQDLTLNVTGTHFTTSGILEVLVIAYDPFYEIETYRYLSYGTLNWALTPNSGLPFTGAFDTFVNDDTLKGNVIDLIQAAPTGSESGGLLSAREDADFMFLMPTITSHTQDITGHTFVGAGSVEDLFVFKGGLKVLTTENKIFEIFNEDESIQYVRLGIGGDLLLTGLGGSGFGLKARIEGITTGTSTGRLEIEAEGSNGQIKIISNNEDIILTVVNDFSGKSIAIPHIAAPTGETYMLTIDENGRIFSDVISGGTSFSDVVFQLYNDADNTKTAVFDLSEISTITTRTYSLPDANGVIALVSDIPSTKAEFNTALSDGDFIFQGSNTITNPFSIIGDNAVTFNQSGTSAFTVINDLRLEADVPQLLMSRVAATIVAAATTTASGGIIIPHGVAPTTPTNGQIWTTSTSIYARINGVTIDLAAGGGGTGDVVGPASAVDNRVVFFDGTTGKLIKDSGLTLSGTNTGDQTTIVGITGTKAQFDTAVTDGNFMYVGDAPTAHTLDSHSNVTITSNTSGELLQWNGTAWINRTLAEAGIQPAGSYLTGNQNITLSGDLTGSGTTSISATIANDAVTFAKFQNITDNRLLGRSAGSDGDMQHITIGSGLSLSAGTLSASGGGAATLDDLTDVVITSALDQHILQYNGTTWENRYFRNPVKQESGTTYTLVAADQNKIIEFTNSGTVTVTLPNGLANDFSASLMKKGTGNVVIVASGTLESSGNTIEIQHTGAVVYHRSGNIWTATGSFGPLASGTFSRSINNISSNTTGAAVAGTDYIYNCTSTFTFTLPTAVGNTNRYTIKNSGTGIITVNTTSSQTIDGDLTAVISIQFASIDVVSDGTNWVLI